MIVTYKITGGQVKWLLLPSGAILEDVLELLDIDKSKVEVTLESIS